MIPGDLLSAFPHRQFHTLPGLLDSWAAQLNSNPNTCMPMQGGSLYHFYDGLWYDPAERRTHDLPCERRTRYRLSQPDTDIYESDFQIHAYRLIIIHIVIPVWLRYMFKFNTYFVFGPFISITFLPLNFTLRGLMKSYFHSHISCFWKKYG